MIVRQQQVHEVTVADMLGNPKAVSFLTEDADCPQGDEVVATGVPPPPTRGGDVGVACYEDPATLGANLRYTASVTPPFAEGDVITVAKGALEDRRGNPSSLTRYTVTLPADNGDNGDFMLPRASVGKVRHTKQASLCISNTAGDAAGTPEARRSLRVTARSTGAAAGAAGNGWRVYPFVDIDPTRTNPAQWVTDIGVDPVHRIISYTIIDRFVTLADLAAAMSADATFRQHFTARTVSTTCPSSATTLAIRGAAGASMPGGRSTVGLRVQFTDHVKSLAGVALHSLPDSLDDYAAPAAFASLFLPDGRDLTGEKRLTVSCLRSGSVVYLQYDARSVANEPLSNIDALLPRAGTPVRALAGIANSYAVTEGTPAPNLRPTVFNLRSDPSIPSQIGYKTSRLADATGLHCGGSS